MRGTETNLPVAVRRGLIAGTTYLGAMWLDNRLSSWRFNDLKLVGQMITTRSPLWQIQGVAGHYGFSVLMTLLYMRYARKCLPGPGWLRGVAFLMLENVALYPAGLILDRLHAGIVSGQLPPMLHGKTFLGQVVRHITFGATLGVLCRRDGQKEG
jgi:hypothetical protein